MGKTILITGASTGIGAAAARTLAEGNTIFVHYNSSEQPAREVAESVSAAGGTAHLIRADLSTREGCVSLVETLHTHTSALDALINNAGGLIRRNPIADGLEWGLMDETFRLNTFSSMLLTSLCLPLLRKGSDPCVINMTSIAARHGAPSATIYGACKGALDSFTRGAAAELAPEIRVNAIAPGVIETPFHDKVSTPERMKQFQEKCPLKRNGSAEHIASAVRFILDNDFLTGETIDVNGGMFMR